MSFSVLYAFIVASDVIVRASDFRSIDHGFDSLLCLYQVTTLGKLSWWCSGERRTRNRKVAGLTPGRGAIKSTRSTQPSIPPG